MLSEVEHAELTRALRGLGVCQESLRVVERAGGRERYPLLIAGSICVALMALYGVFYSSVHESLTLSAGQWIGSLVAAMFTGGGTAWVSATLRVRWLYRRRDRLSARVDELRAGQGAAC